MNQSIVKMKIDMKGEIQDQINLGIEILERYLRDKESLAHTKPSISLSSALNHYLHYHEATILHTPRGTT